jgi:hypothetical protein
MPRLTRNSRLIMSISDCELLNSHGLQKPALIVGISTPTRERNVALALWLGLTAALASPGGGLGSALCAEAWETYIDLRMPRPFTSPDGGETRCFDAVRCYGPPEGGWAWQAEDVGKFDASAPLPPFDPNRPRPYRSVDGGQTRCFIGYRCYGPPPGGWLWTENGDAQATWYQRVWSWIRGAIVPWIGDVGLPATNEALQQGLPDPISMPLSGVESSVTIAQVLLTIEKDGNTQIMDQTVAGLCPAKTCSKKAITDAADELSEYSFMGTHNISQAVSVAPMSHAQYQSFVQSVVTEWAKNAGYRMQ